LGTISKLLTGPYCLQKFHPQVNTAPYCYCFPW